MGKKLPTEIDCKFPENCETCPICEKNSTKESRAKLGLCLNELDVEELANMRAMSCHGICR